MADDDDQITLKIHGLEVDNDFVLADVFAKKLGALVNALKRVDRLEHDNKIRHRYIIADLRFGSACATVREKAVSLRNPPKASSVKGLLSLVSSIHDGDTSRAATYPKPLLNDIRIITYGSEKMFSHAEIHFWQGRAFRIDKFLEERVREVTEVANDDNILASPGYFLGTAYGTFDGMLVVLDARGTVLRGKLILDVGRIELDCVMSMDEIPNVREYFKKHVSVEAVAHYDGHQQLPIRLEIRNVRELAEAADLTRWRGAIEPRAHDDFDDEW
ncbi:MAG: hypothetical protein H7840_00365 [Alphaproteobacteria bacterium]